MFPLHDDNPTHRFAILTVLLIAMNVAIFAFQSSKPDTDLVAEFQGSQAAFVCEFGVLPERLGGNVALDPQDLCVLQNQEQSRLTSLITHQFMHGSLMHLLGNMLFLFIFANNVEDRLGRVRFLPFYLLCGIIAAIGQIMLTPNSTSLLIGASGAISGVLGAYLVLFPKVRVLALVGIIPLRLPAWVILGAYLAFQFFYVSRASGIDGGGGVAYWAHIIGFVAGLLLVIPFRAERRPPGPRPAFG